MKIVVAQKQDSDLGGIAKGVFDSDPRLVNQIIFTTSPDKILEEASRGGPILIISSEIYDQTRGSTLAEEVKNVNPQAIFLIYSIMPKESDFIDGFIEKELDTSFTEEHPLVVKILTSELSDTTTIEDIKLR